MTNAISYSMEQLLPHDAPMILIDDALDASDNHLTAQVTICADSLFYNEQQQAIPSWVGMEMMAQTIAAYAGFQALQKNETVKVGFLLGTRKYQCSQPCFAKGESYQVRVEKLYQEDNGLGSFKCTMHHNAELVASSNINVFSPPNIDEFLEQQVKQG